MAVSELGGPVASNATGVTFGGPPPAPPPAAVPAPSSPPPQASGITSNLNLTGTNANTANFNNSDFRQRYAEVLANVRSPCLLTKNVVFGSSEPKNLSRVQSLVV